MGKTKVKGRSIAVLMALSLVVTGSMAGCGKKDNTGQTTAPTTQSGSQGTTQGGSQASTEGQSAADRKLVVGIQTNSFITDYEDNYLTKLIEEKLNCDLEMYLLPMDNTETRTKISLMVTSRDNMPDVILGGSLTPEMVLDYGSKGAFINLNDYLNDAAKMPNFNAIPEEDRNNMMTAMTSADGNAYVLAMYQPETWNLTPNRMFINGVWLEKLGLEVPTTTDELHNVLTHFCSDDPNGNGIKDEIGVYGYAEGGYGQNTIMALMNSFVFYNGGGQNGGLALDETGNTVIAPFTTEGWKKGLTYMNQLYNEGLLAASIFTDDDTQFKATLNNSSANIVGFVSAGSTGNWPDVDNNENFQELDIISPLTGPDGVRYTPYTEYSADLMFYITSACKNPDLAIEFGDLFYDDKMSKTVRFGEEGVDWTEDPAECANYSNSFVDAGLYDKINLIYKTNIWAENSNKFWHNVQPRYASLTLGNTIGNAMTDYDPDKKSSKLGAYSYANYYPAHPEKILSLLHYTAEEAEQITEAVTNISDYVKQSMAEFITGARSIDGTWDSYLKEMDNMGLQDWLKCAQTAYDRTK